MPTSRKSTAQAREQARIAEYVDSADMTQRLRQGKLVTARIFGNYGVYRTQAAVGKKVTGQCSCPSQYWPCKHVYALRKTWQVNPDSFLDLNEFLKGLAGRSKADLIKAIGQIAMNWPESLRVFGVPGFELADDEADEWEDEFDGEWEDQ